MFFLGFLTEQWRRGYHKMGNRDIGKAWLWQAGTKARKGTQSESRKPFRNYGSTIPAMGSLCSSSATFQNGLWQFGRLTMKTPRDYHNRDTNKEFTPFYQEVGAAVLTDVLQQEAEMREKDRLVEGEFFPISVGIRCAQLEMSRRMYNRYLRFFVQDHILKRKKIGPDKLNHYKIQHDSIEEMIRG